MNKIKVAIAGGTGYTAGELIRLLINHPFAELQAIFSTTSVGQKITSFHTDLIGETELEFSQPNDQLEYDVLFLCLGHGLSREFIDNHTISKDCKIIDLGNDFRNQPQHNNMNFIYGLTDFNLDKISTSSFIANPGCFATSIELALLPLAETKMLNQEIHIQAITGSTGAGRKLALTSHFSYRDANLSTYKAFTHQHLEEINNVLQEAQGKKIGKLNFIPIRGNHTRGIFSSIYTKIPEGEEFDKVVNLYKEYYLDSPFVHISDTNISMKDVVNTNKCLIYLEKHDDYIYIVSVIDNLLKGASGQAVENMNIIFGFERTTGLKLKAGGF